MQEEIRVLRLAEPLVGWLAPKMEIVSGLIPKVDREFEKVFSRSMSNSLAGHVFRDVIGHELCAAISSEGIPGLEGATYDKPPVTAVHVIVDGVKFRFLREGNRFSKKPAQFLLPETTLPFDNIPVSLASDYLLIHTFGEDIPTLSVAKPMFQGEVMTRSVRLEWRYAVPLDRFQGNPRPFSSETDDYLEQMIRPTYERYTESYFEREED